MPLGAVDGLGDEVVERHVAEAGPEVLTRRRSGFLLDPSHTLEQAVDRRPPGRDATDRDGDGQPDLIVTGVAVLGDIEVRD